MIDFGNRDFVQIDVVAAMLLGDGPHHVFAGGVAELDDRLGEADVGVLGDLPGLVELVLADDPLAKQDFGKVTLASHGGASSFLGKRAKSRLVAALADGAGAGREKSAPTPKPAIPRELPLQVPLSMAARPLSIHRAGVGIGGICRANRLPDQRLIVCEPNWTMGSSTSRACKRNWWASVRRLSAELYWPMSSSSAARPSSRRASRRSRSP